MVVRLIKKFMVQLVYGRSPDRDYILADLTLWTGHDVMRQEDLVSSSVPICCLCHGAVVDRVCSLCYHTYVVGAEVAPWEGLILTGPKPTVAAEVARFLERLPSPADLSSIYLPQSVHQEEALLEASRRPVRDLLSMGTFQVYKAESLRRDLESGRSLESAVEMFLGL